MRKSAQTTGSRAAVWVTAIRPKTLSASIAPVMVGGAVAWRDNVSHWPLLFAAFGGAVAIQIVANLANDLFDYKRGADNESRIGPLRVTQSGLVTEKQMRMAIGVVTAVALLIGVYLITRGGWPVVAIGLSGIVCALLYTGGPLPYGYHGLGDLFVFIFFGPVAVVGTYYVQAQSASTLAWLVSIPVGALTTAILVVNNVRDMETDRKAGKRTLAVVLGRTGSITEFGILLALGAGVPLALVISGVTSTVALIPTAVAAIALPYFISSLRSTDPRMLNQLLARTSLLLFIYALTLSIGVAL